MKIAHAACCGIAHQQKQIECQDVVSGKVWDTYSAIVLADGAGSCAFAKEGAQTVVDTVLELIAQHGEAWLYEHEQRNSLCEELIDGCLNALAKNGHPMEEQASTLLFCIADAQGAYLCGHIGDGYAFIAGPESKKLLSDAENGKRHNETVFVTSPGAASHLRLIEGRLEKNECVILCSDGAGESLYQRETKDCALALQRIASWMCLYQGTEVSRILELNLENAFRENSADDMSLAVITHLEEGA